MGWRSVDSADASSSSSKMRPWLTKRLSPSEKLPSSRRCTAKAMLKLHLRQALRSLRHSSGLLSFSQAASPGVSAGKADPYTPALGSAGAGTAAEQPCSEL